LKDYDHVILWLDYFNKNLSRSKGRKVKRDKSVFDPSLLELIDAAMEAGYNPTKLQKKWCKKEINKKPFIDRM
jgi:signal recognition particle subunit SRP19